MFRCILLLIIIIVIIYRMFICIIIIIIYLLVFICSVIIMLLLLLLLLLRLYILHYIYQGFRWVLKSLKLYKKVLIMISGGLKFGDRKARFAIWMNVMIQFQKALISLNKHERCAFKVRCCAALCSVFTGKTVIFVPNATPAVREWTSNLT